jgi:hypothetical protein
MLAHCADDGGKKARLTREITKETVKTIAQGMPVAGFTCGDLLVCFLFLHARLRVPAKRRHSLRPLIEREG